MLSFDTSSLYTNIPIVDTSNIIKFFDLGNLVSITTWYTFSSQFYHQTDNVAMGKPTSPTSKNFYMQVHGKAAKSTALHPPKVLEQFFDDIFCILRLTPFFTRFFL